MKIGNGEFWLGDCLELMQQIPDGSVDMVVTSPPYDDLRTYNGSLTDWCFETFVAISDQLIRVLRDNGVIVWNVSDATVRGSETGSSFRQVLSMMDRGMLLADTMIYKKANPGGARGSNKTYIQCFEYMFVLSKGVHDTFNLIKDRRNKKPGKQVGGGKRKPDGSIGSTQVLDCEEYGRRFNIWEMPTQQNTDHPAPFPIQLAHDHIISWSNPGDLILDPFAGSGTTAVAAERTNRRWICIERLAEYYYPAVGRVWQDTQQ